MLKIYKLVFLLIFYSSLIPAQNYTLSGVVSSAATGEKLTGANVFVKGTTSGTASDADGKYSITLKTGSYTVVCSYVGFETQEVQISLTNNMELNFRLKDYQFSLSVTVLADRAKERETPVAFTNIEKRDIESKLGSRDIPLVLNTTPSVYATQNGGGAGDARINIRGFNQRNVAIMINGVPVNDMENGWVYWSNWDGVADATSSIQVQRGLSAVNLATPSIGGTMNIITDPTAAKFGVRFKQEFGEARFMKSTLSASTGLVDNKWAANAVIVRKIGEGVFDKTWTDAWAYYFGASYSLDENNRIELYFLGAPQRHGQNSYKQNIATYSHDFAKELKYPAGALTAFPEAGIEYNQTWNNVDPLYSGKQFAAGFFSSTGSEFDRYNKNYINERENYFHKPIANLNWYSQLSSDLSLYTTLYWSGGHGGGTGTFGSMKWDYTLPNSRIADWNATIATNQANLDADGVANSKGILRNSVNNQWTIGAIAKAFYKISDNFKTSVGVDWRTAEIDHYREVRDLLGGEYYLWTGNEFDTPDQYKKKLGDRFNYDFTNTVDWIGFYGQGEFTHDQFTVYGMGGYSMIKYTYTNHFIKGDDGNKLTAESDNISGYQAKGGASFRATKDLIIYANAGYVSKVPIFDNVIDDGDGTKAEDPDNEKFLNFEGGLNFWAFKGILALKANAYYTTWNDRTNTRGVINPDGSEGLIFLSGLDSKHYGFEFEAAYMPIRELRFDFSAGIGDWTYTNDVSGTYKDYSGGLESVKEFNYYIKDLKVGDQPQTAFSLITTVFPVDGLSASAVIRHYRDHYAEFSPFSRTNKDDRAQSWKTPIYTVVDFHFTYDLPFNLQGVNFQLFGHIFNLLDELYISDAVDNSQFSSYKVDGKIFDSHGASAAEVYMGLPRTFNLGISVSY